ncbi:hypothetical protein, partial [Bradyrhizobium sp.]|uniref:hypothetical protein n=1 Tax=Bradyrhizobium sp. TaxID=376 RepID=UPI00261245FB
AAKRADLSHWKISCLKGWASKPAILSDRSLILRSLLNCRASGFVQSPTAICKKIGTQVPISGKSNCTNSSNFYCQPVASGFFTDDEIERVQKARGASGSGSTKLRVRQTRGL